MGLMRFRRLTSMRINRFTNFIILLVLSVIGLSGCSKDEYPRSTRHFYVNDYAIILYGATKKRIILEGEALYEETKGLDDGGAQLVITTFEVNTSDEIAGYDKTELFRK
jgi:hypothetical protein